MEKRVRFSRRARQDVAGIKRWTRQQFGVQQVADYLKLIALAVNEIGENPATPRARKVSHNGIELMVLALARKGHNASHYLVYRIHPSGNVEIIRVLHEKMDQESRLADTP